MLEPQDRIRFEQLVLPHLDSAANLARWLLRNRADSDDVVQEAMLRAYRFFERFHGDDARAWLLQIVRNACYTWLEKNRPSEMMTEFDEEVHQLPSATPETLAAQADERQERCSEGEHARTVRPSSSRVLKADDVQVNPS